MLRRILSLFLLTLVVTAASHTLATRHSKGEAIFRADEERALDDQIPKHLPIKVKLRSEKEKAFKDLKNENWLGDFELEVTNVSSKAIYFLELWLMLPDTKTENNSPLAFSLRYGRADFIHFDALAVADDVRLKPQETYTFTIPPGQQKAWQQFKLRRNEPDPGKVELKFIQLSFGDGSGFDGGGESYPYQRD